MTLYGVFIFFQIYYYISYSTRGRVEFFVSPQSRWTSGHMRNGSCTEKEEDLRSSFDDRVWTPKLRESRDTKVVCTYVGFYYISK